MFHESRFHAWNAWNKHLSSESKFPLELYYRKRSIISIYRFFFSINPLSTRHVRRPPRLLMLFSMLVSRREIQIVSRDSALQHYAQILSSRIGRTCSFNVREYRDRSYDIVFIILRNSNVDARLRALSILGPSVLAWLTIPEWQRSAACLVQARL